MAETEIKSINGRTVCDQTARDAAKACVKTINGAKPDENGNVIMTALGGVSITDDGNGNVIIA